MKRTNRSAYKATPLSDFQVLKGDCLETMKAFGSPVMANHEAKLMIRDDQESSALNAKASYAIHQRSENRILEIIEPKVRVLESRKGSARKAVPTFPLKRSA